MKVKFLDRVEDTYKVSVEDENGEPAVVTRTGFFLEGGVYDTEDLPDLERMCTRKHRGLFALGLAEEVK